MNNLRTMTTRRCTFIVCGAAFLLTITSCLMLPAVVLASDPTFDDINQVADQLSCPTCAGISLTDCGTVTCEQWKEQIGDLLREGYNQQEVLDYFATRHGQQVLQEPPVSGSTLWLWVMPIAALLVGGMWLTWLMRRWRPAPAVATVKALEETEAVSDSYLSQVEQDLKDGAL